MSKQTEITNSFNNCDNSNGNFIIIDKQASVALYNTLNSINDNLANIYAFFEKQSSNNTVCPYSLHTWLDEWLEVFKKPNVKAGTLYTYDVAIRVHIKPNLANLPLNQFDGIMLQKFIMSIEHSRTRKTVLNVLNASFRQAFELNYIPSNPMKSVKIPTHQYKQGEALTVQEQTKFIENIKGHPLEYYFLFVLFTGCRRSEALSLTTDDIDLEKGLIHIRGTKSSSSDRYIPISKNLADLLPLFVPKNRKVVFDFRADYATHSFKKLCPNHKLHDLRHTFATNCVESKIPLKVVQKWLGHSDFEITANIYTHISEDFSMQEIGLIDNFIIEKKLLSD